MNENKAPLEEIKLEPIGMMAPPEGCVDPSQDDAPC